MTTAIARSATQDAFDQLSILFKGDWGAIDSFTLARLEKTARSGLACDPALSHQILAIVAAVRWDDRMMDELFCIAMRYDASGTIEANYAATLDGVGRCIEAANLYERASEIRPTDLSVLRKAMNANWRAGRWQRALDFAETLGQRSPDLGIEHLDERRQVVEVATRLGVLPPVIEKLHVAVHTFLHQQKYRSSGSSCDLDTSPDDEAIYVTVLVDANQDEVERLDEQLTPILFRAVDNLPLSSFCIGLDAREAARDA